MNTLQNFSMPPDQFLSMAGNVLHKSLLEVKRAQAKRIFGDISDGKRVPVMNVQMDEDTQVRFDLSMDASEFRGDRLNFRFFRNSLISMVFAFNRVLEEKATIPVFTEEGGGTMMVGVPGVTDDTGVVNIMMLTADVREPGCVHMKLVYMPEQGAPGQVAAETAGASREPG